MKNLYYLILAALLGLAVGAQGCTPPVDDDDDDASADDDDDDDDDDDYDDDDDASSFTLAALTFEGVLTVGSDAGDDDDSSAGDDDDSSAGDDDDSSAGDDDDSAGGNANNNATMQYTFEYWAEYSSSTQVLNCIQVIEVDAEIVYGAGAVADGTCNNCTGLLTVDPTTAVDVSNPAADPEHCDPAVLAAEGVDYGIGLTLTKSNGGFYGDFETMGLMDDSIHSALGIDWSQNGGQSAADLEEGFAKNGLDYVGSGLVQDNAGTLANASGLTGVAVAAGAGSNWYGYWRIIRNPADNPHESTSDNGYTLSGDYGLGAMWVITFGG